MSISRRNLIKLGALAGAISLSMRGIGAETTSARVGKPLRILILGGTGFIGPHQVRYAVARGHEVTVFNRGQRQADLPPGIEHLNGDRDIGKLDALKDREWDVCIDNPTSVPFWVRDVGRMLQGKIGQYVFVSTISAYADNSRPHADEDSALATYDGKDAMAETRDTLKADMRLYGPLKAASEREAARWFPGITTIVRPGLIAGPGDATDRFTYWPLRLARGGEVLGPGDGNDPVQFIDARDLAEWMIRMVEARSFGIYNALGPNYPLSMAAMLYGIRATGASAARMTWVPADFLEAQGVSAWSDMPVWVPADGETAGFASRDNARAIARGLTFRPLATTSIDTLEWFKGLAEGRQSSPQAGLDARREAQVLAAWHARGAGAKQG